MMVDTNNQYDVHRKFAVECFNGTWDLLDKKNRTPEDSTQMIHMAHASRYHWGEIGTPLNFARGDWQISRVYATLGEFQNALTYAKSCLQLCQDHGFDDFDLAFAYEALARAYAVAGNTAARDQHLELAKAAGEAIEKDDDKGYFFSQLATIS